jgi:hypothetical protein
MMPRCRRAGRKRKGPARQGAARARTGGSRCPGRRAVDVQARWPRERLPDRSLLRQVRRTGGDPGSGVVESPGVGAGLDHFLGPARRSQGAHQGVVGAKLVGVNAERLGALGVQRASQARVGLEPGGRSPVSSIAAARPPPYSRLWRGTGACGAGDGQDQGRGHDDDRACHRVSARLAAPSRGASSATEAAGPALHE